MYIKSPATRDLRLCLLSERKFLLSPPRLGNNFQFRYAAQSFIFLEKRIRQRNIVIKLSISHFCANCAEANEVSFVGNFVASPLLYTQTSHFPREMFYAFLLVVPAPAYSSVSVHIENITNAIERKRKSRASAYFFPRK